MAVKLRLMRMGKTKQPTYRLVVSDARAPRNGRYIELLGTYEPRQDPSRIKIDAERAQRWLASGAQPTERVQKLLVAEGILTGEAAAKTEAAKKAARRPAKVKAEKAPEPGATAEAETSVGAGPSDAGETASEEEA